MLKYAGANNPLWIVPAVTEGQTLIVEIKADKMPVGLYDNLIWNKLFQKILNFVYFFLSKLFFRKIKNIILLKNFETPDLRIKHLTITFTSHFFRSRTIVEKGKVD